MNGPLVSICIPVYNGEEYLRQCLDTCVNQTYKNIEIIICDDGSTDNSEQIVETYRLNNSNIRFFKNEVNLGLVGNWNNCIEKAKGEWIKFIFQDDYLSSDSISCFVENIESDVKLIVSERNFILPANAAAEQKHYYEHVVRTLTNTIQQEGPFYAPGDLAAVAVKYMGMNFIAEPSLTFFKKDLVDQIGVFNASLKQICDLEFFLRAGSIFGLKYIPQKLCAFRIHDSSTTSTNTAQKYYEMRYIEPLLLSYFLSFSPIYKPFRNQLGFFQRIKLAVYFRVKTYNAYRVNIEENRQFYVFEENSPFPEIYSKRRGNVLIRLIAQVKK